MFIQTENTPNPNAIKFLPNELVSPLQPIFFNNAQEARKSSTLAFRLFEIEGVEAVFFGKDFITITKAGNIDWEALKAEILMIIMDHYTLNLPALDKEDDRQAQSIDLNTLGEIEKQIIEIIETRVRPSVAMDGGDIIYRGFENGVVLLELRGSCSGCPSSTVTLKQGIENMLKHFVPEVETVEAVE